MKDTIDNFPTIEIPYKKLDKIIDKIIKKSGNEPKLTFSIYETVGDDGGDLDKWKIKSPDILSELPVFKGKCVFFGENYTSSVINNPTWGDIIIQANHAANGDHIFLESVGLSHIGDNKVKYIEMWFGS